MKSPVRTLAIAVAMFCAAGAFAQTAAPAAKASAPVVTTPAAKATPATPATPAAPAAKSAKTAKTVAPGGGDGKVWVNTASKVYHCEGSKDYGTTKVGEYMTEADAKAKGFHGVKGKSCAK